MTMWYDQPETEEERAGRIDRYGNEIRPAPTAFDRVVDRAHELVRPRMIRPPRGIAMPFGLPEAVATRWRVSVDVWEVLRRGSIESSTQRLFGSEVEIDPKAEGGTLELLEEALG
jgi:hypothetical protein